MDLIDQLNDVVSEFMNPDINLLDYFDNVSFDFKDAYQVVDGSLPAFALTDIKAGTVKESVSNKKPLKDSEILIQRNALSYAYVRGTIDNPFKFKIAMIVRLQAAISEILSNYDISSETHTCVLIPPGRLKRTIFLESDFLARIEYRLWISKKRD
jgi:hypothetical protein